jgi:hypothetical protein
MEATNHMQLSRKHKVFHVAGAPTLRKEWGTRVV